MKLNLIILIVVIVLGVYVGLNINKEPVTSKYNEASSTKNVSKEKEKSEEPKIKKSKQDYTYKIVHKVKKRYDKTL